MRRKKVMEKVRRYVEKELKPSCAFGDDDHLLHDDVIDSVAAVDLVIFLNKEFDKHIRLYDLKRLRLDTINGIADMVTKGLGGL